MALTATIFKVNAQISDLDRGYYAEHQLTLARHPSETDERMMVRLIAFALHASDELTFTRGLCVDDEPELWQKSLTGEIDLWIDVGQPDPKRLRKACARARQVVLYTYGGSGARQWWQRNAEALQRFVNLAVYELPEESLSALPRLVKRSMQLHCTIQDGQIWVGDEAQGFAIIPTTLKPVEG